MSDPKFRSFCRQRGIAGKAKKRLRQELRDRAAARHADANIALATRQQTDQLFNNPLLKGKEAR